MIEITDTAKKKFKEVAEAEKRKGHQLRVMVHGGGTFSPQFGLDFVAPGDESKHDTVVDAEGFKVVIDPESAKYLDDATVDFIEGPGGGGFKISAPHAGPADPADPLARSVQDVITTKINPSIAGHGGVVSLVAIEDGIAVLRFGGGCQGCGMSNVTLKNGIEKVLLEDIPGLKGVRDVTDHTAGTNPYY